MCVRNVGTLLKFLAAILIPTNILSTPISCLMDCDNEEERNEIHNHEKQITMRTKNINISLPRAKTGYGMRLMFYPTMHCLCSCDFLVFALRK